MSDESRLVYVVPKMMSRDEVQNIFADGDSKEIAEAILSVANYDEDWRYAEKWCLHFLEGDDPFLARIAAIGIADVDRRHHKLNYKSVASALNARMARKGASEELSNRILLTLEDISYRGQRQESDA